MNLKHITGAVVLSLSLTAFGAIAQTAAPAVTPAAKAAVVAAPAKVAKAAKKAPSAKQLAQREKMKTCNKQAAGKKGDERKAFMKSCLSN